MQSRPKPIGFGGGQRTAKRFVWKSASGMKGPVRRIGGISNTQSGREFGVEFEGITDLDAGVGRVGMYEVD
jgi:hypothetical protein